MKPEIIEHIVRTCLARATEMLATNGEVPIHTFVVTGLTAIIAAPTPGMGKDDYAFALAKLAKDAKAEAVVMIAESWTLDAPVNETDLADLPLPSTSPNRVECLAISFKTREGLAGVRIVKMIRTEGSVRLDTDIRALTMPTGASFNRYLDGVFQDVTH